MYTEDTDISKEVLAKLPKPTGYRVLIALPRVNEMTKGGILMPKNLVDREHVASIVAKVLAVGPDVYRDETRFPSGPYCEVGNWVMIKAYSGIRFKVDGQEFRLINDDSVEGLVDGPVGFERA